MKALRYAVYPPPRPSFPFLAVVLKDNKPVDMFGCPYFESATRVLGEMEARTQAKNGAAFT
jgi:hypothetical protein